MIRARPIAFAIMLAPGLATPVFADRLVEGGIGDGHWEGEGMKGGNHLEFQMDAKTVTMSNEHPDD